MKRYVQVLVTLTALTTAGRADAPPTPSRFYSLHFVVQEVDGTNVVNSREYDTTAGTGRGEGCSLRTESRVNISTIPNSSNFFSLHVKIDVPELQERGSGLALQVLASVDTTPREQDSNTGFEHSPIVRTNSWNSTLFIPLRKPTVLFSSDDLTSKHKMQLVLTATPIL